MTSVHGRGEREVVVREVCRLRQGHDEPRRGKLRRIFARHATVTFYSSFIQVVNLVACDTKRQDGLLLHKQRDVAVGVHLHGQGQSRKSAFIRRIQHTKKSLTGLETRT